MTDPKVSCIIPVYNGERYLRETLDSVFAQTHGNREVIVIDDGSTDASTDIVKGYGKPILCVSQPNAGHAAARNHGIGLATGDFIACIDADDLWHPEKLQRQLQRFTARPELGIVFSHLENFVSPDVDPAELPATGDAPCASVPGYNSTCMLTRREVFERVGLLDVSLKHGNDRDWLCRAAEHSVSMEMLPDVLVRRRLHKTNRSSALADRSRAEYLRIIKNSLDRRRRETGEMKAYPFAGQNKGE